MGNNIVPPLLPGDPTAPKPQTFDEKFQSALPQEPRPQPQQQGASSEFDRLFNQALVDQDDLAERSMLATYRLAVKDDPDMRAEAQSIARDLGADPDMVGRNIDVMRRLAQQRYVRSQEFSKNSPILASRLQDLEFARIAHDDLENLSWYERAAQNFEAGQLEVERGRLGTRMMRSPHAVTEFDLNRMAEIERRLDILPRGDSVVGMTGRVVGQMWETTPTTLAAAGAAALLAGLATGGSAAAPVGMGTAALVGGYQTYEIEAGNAYRDYVLAGMDRRVAVTNANAVGIINGLIEVGTIGVVGKPITSAGRKFLNRYVQRQLLKRETYRSLGRAATQYAMGVGAETAGEAVQEVVTAIGEKLGLDRTQDLRDAQVGVQAGDFNLPGGGTVRTNPDGTLDVTPDVFERVTGQKAKGEFVRMDGEVAQNFLADLNTLYPIEAALSDDEFMSDVMRLAFETAGHAIKGMWLPTLPGPVMDYMASRKRIAQAEVASKQFDEMVEKAAESKLNKRDSAQFALHLKRTLQGKPFEKVYIDREEMKAALSKAEIDIDQVEAVLPGTREQMERVSSEQPDIVYDGGQFLSRMSESELLDVLRPHVRADRDALSDEQAGVRKGELDTEAETLQQQLDEDAEVQAQWDVALDQIQETSYTEQVAAGIRPVEARANAELHRSAIQAMARQTGINPVEFLTDPALRLRTEQATRAEPANLFSQDGTRKTDTPEFKAWFGDSKVVDAEGQPVRVFRGRRPQSGDVVASDAAYFTYDRDAALEYSLGMNAAELRELREEADPEFLESTMADANVLEAWVRLENPASEQDVRQVAAEEGIDLVDEATPAAYLEQSPELVQSLRDRGFDGAIGADGRFDGAGSIESVAVFASEQVKSVNNRGTFDPSDPNILRAGGDDPLGQFDSKKLRILIHKKHNASTWMHEFSHYWFELTARLAREGRASEQMVADLDTVAKWAGLDSAEDFLTAPDAQWRQVHEAFAYSFESYLYENKAPSVELRNVFRRFAKWLVEAYATVVNRLNAAYMQETGGKALPALTPEVRAVMDRMLATDEQIDARMQEEAIGQFLQDDAEMTAEQRDRLSRYLWDAENEAKEELRAIYMREVRHLRSFRGREIKRLQKEGRKRRKEAEAEEREALLRNDRVAQLQHWLATGEEVDSDGALGFMGEKPKIASDDKRWGRGRRSPDGVSEELVAEVFGFDTVDQMLGELDQALPLDEEVLARADARMMQENSELLDQESIEASVDAAVNNRALMKLRAAEAKVMDAAMPNQSAIIAAAKQVAKRIVGKLDVGQLTRGEGRIGAPRSYALAAARAEKAAWVARGRGDIDTMRRQQRIAIQQRALAQEAYARRDQLRRDVESLTSRVRPGGAERETYLGRAYGGDVISTVREMLAHWGIGDGARNRTDENFTPWRNLGENDPLRAELELAYRFVTEENGRDWSALSVDQAEGVLLTMSGTLRKGRQAREIELGDRRIHIEDLVAQLEQLAEEQGRKPIPSQPGTKWDDAKAALASANAKWQRIEPLLQAIDGGRAGILTQTLWEPAVDRALAMRAQEKDVLDRLRASLDPLQRQQLEGKTREVTAQFLTDPTTGKPWVFRNGKLDIIGALLHSGNDSNLIRLIGGNGWGDANPDTMQVDRSAWDQQLDAWHRDGTVTREDWRIVQDIWAIYDDLLPQTQAAHYAILGHEMEVVERGFVRTPWGEIPGGYVPAAADPTRSNRARTQQADDMLEQLRTMPTVWRGQTKQRVEHNYRDRPLDLDPLRQAQHFHRALVFAHMGPEVLRLNRILQNRDVRTMLERLEPGIYANYLEHWTKTVASQSTTLGSDGDPFAGSTLLRTLRRSAGTAAMMGNVVNSAQNISGAVLAAAKVKPKFLALAVGDLMSAPRDTARLIADQSAYMRDRHQKGNTIYEVRDRIDDLRKSANAIVRSWQKMQQFLSKHTYFMQEWTQKPLDRVVWLGAYKQEMAESGRADRAVKAGDAAVRQTQGDTLAVSLAEGEKGSDFIKLFTQFSSWFVMMGSLRARAMRDPGDMMLVAGAAFPMLLTLAMGEVISEMLRGDDEKDLDQTAIEALRNTIISIPRVAGPVGTAASTVVATLLNGDSYQQRMPSPPAVSLATRALQAGARIARGDEVDADQQLDFAEMVMALLGVPIQVVTRRARAGFGEDEFSARGLLTGR